MKVRPRAPAVPRSETKRCAVYTRKSTTAGLDQAFSSLDAQRESCVSYVQRQPGWGVLETSYDDGGYTGANTDRPAFQRLLADIDARKIDVVVVYKVDRLSRSLLDFVSVMQQFEAAGVAFVSVTQNFSTADAMGRFTMNMLMSFAEFEREMIGERTRDKIRAARRKGQWTGGQPPFGYNVVDKKLVVDELNAIVVCEIFSTYLELRSAFAVVRALNERGRVTKNGRSWTRNDVLRVLHHPVYAGYIASGDELHEGEHSAIIERAVFARAQVLLEAAQKERRTVGRNPDYLLRGVLHCGCCGAAFTPASTTQADTVYRYYRCATKLRRGKAACPAAQLPAQAIEDRVVEQVRAATADGALAAEVTAAVDRQIKRRRQDIVVERQQIPPKLAALAHDIENLVDSLATVQPAARRPIETRLAELEKQRGAYEAQLAAAERELARIASIEVESTWVAQCLADFDRMWNLLTPENRGRLVAAVVNRVEVDEPADSVRIVITDLGAALTAAGADGDDASGAPDLATSDQHAGGGPALGAAA